MQAIVRGSNLVTFGAGFKPQTVIPGFDLCAVFLCKLPLNADICRRVVFMPIDFIGAVVKVRSVLGVANLLLGYGKNFPVLKHAYQSSLVTNALHSGVKWY